MMNYTSMLGQRHIRCICSLPIIEGKLRLRSMGPLVGFELQIDVVKSLYQTFKV